MRRRAGSRPTPIITGHVFSQSEHSLPLVPPLTPATEQELRKSCSLILLQPPPKTPRERTHSVPPPSSPLPRERTHSIPPPAHTTRDLPPFPRSPLPPRSSSHTPPPNTAYAFARTATARKLSVITTTNDSTSTGARNLRASQIEIRRYDPGTPITGDRTSTFLLAKPTLVDVLPSPRPRTAGTTASSGWGVPLTPMCQHEKSGSIATTESGGGGCSGGSANKRLSLFPRPRTAHGGETEELRALPPLPLPASKLGDKEAGKSEVESATTTTTGKKSKKEVKGFVHLSAFFKATFRFGKRVRSGL